MGYRDFSSFWNRDFQPQSVSAEFLIFPALDEIERDRVSGELPADGLVKLARKSGRGRPRRVWCVSDIGE